MIEVIKNLTSPRKIAGAVFFFVRLAAVVVMASLMIALMLLVSAFEYVFTGSGRSPWVEL